MAYSAKTLLIIFVCALVWTGALASTEYIIYDPGIGSVLILWMVFAILCIMKLVKTPPKPNESSPESKIVIST